MSFTGWLFTLINAAIFIGYWWIEKSPKKVSSLQSELIVLHKKHWGVVQENRVYALAERDRLKKEGK